MNTTKLKTILGGALLAAGVLFALPAHAQENGGGEKKARPERPEGGGRGENLARLKEALGLTDEQVEKLKPIFAAQQKEIQELNKEAASDAERAARREKVKAIREKYKPQIAAILTAEQNEKLAKIQARRGGPGGPGGGEGKKGEGKKGKGEGDGAGAPPPPPAE